MTTTNNNIQLNFPMYRPTPLEQAYTSYILQKQFYNGIETEQITVRSNEAFPFLMTSGLPPPLLQSIWFVVDPSQSGTLTRRHQLLILLRLISLCQSSLLSFTSVPPPSYLLQALENFKSIQLSLAFFQCLPVPSSAVLLGTYGKTVATTEVKKEEEVAAVAYGGTQKVVSIDDAFSHLDAGIPETKKGGEETMTNPAFGDFNSPPSSSMPTTTTGGDATFGSFSATSTMNGHGGPTSSATAFGNFDSLGGGSGGGASTLPSSGFGNFNNANENGNNNNNTFDAFGNMNSNANRVSSAFDTIDNPPTPAIPNDDDDFGDFTDVSSTPTPPTTAPPPPPPSSLSFKPSTGPSISNLKAAMMGNDDSAFNKMLMDGLSEAILIKKSPQKTTKEEITTTTMAATVVNGQSDVTTTTTSGGGGFGNFGNFEAASSNAAATAENDGNDDKFSHFDNLATTATMAPAAAVAANDDDFGDFGGAAAVTDDDDDFGDFGGATTTSETNDATSFGNFDTAFNNTNATNTLPTAVVPPSSENDKFGAFDSLPTPQPVVNLASAGDENDDIDDPFHSLPTPPQPVVSAPITTSAVPGDDNNDDDSFGNFEEVKPPPTPTDDFGEFTEVSSYNNQQHSDDFGDFTAVNDTPPPSADIKFKDPALDQMKAAMMGNDDNAFNQILLDNLSKALITNKKTTTTVEKDKKEAVKEEKEMMNGEFAAFESSGGPPAAEMNGGGFAAFESVADVVKEDDATTTGDKFSHFDALASSTIPESDFGTFGSAAVTTTTTDDTTTEAAVPEESFQFDDKLPSKGDETVDDDDNFGAFETVGAAPLEPQDNTTNDKFGAFDSLAPPDEQPAASLKPNDGDNFGAFETVGAVTIEPQDTNDKFGAFDSLAPPDEQPAASSTPANDDNDDNFGAFDTTIAAAISSNNEDTTTTNDKFGAFDSLAAAAPTAPLTMTTNDISKVTNDADQNDFGDFGAATIASSSVHNDDKFNHFDSLVVAPAADNTAASAATISMTSDHKNDNDKNEYGNFGDFNNATTGGGDGGDSTAILPAPPSEPEDKFGYFDTLATPGNNNNTLLDSAPTMERAPEPLTNVTVASNNIINQQQQPSWGDFDAPATTTTSVPTEDSAHDKFNHFDSLAVPPPPTDPAPVIIQDADDDFGDFGHFDSAPAAPAEVSTHYPVGDLPAATTTTTTTPEDDDFGDFGTFNATTDPVVPPLDNNPPPTSISSSSDKFNYFDSLATAIPSSMGGNDDSSSPPSVPPPPLPNDITLEKPKQQSKKLLSRMSTISNSDSIHFMDSRTDVFNTTTDDDDMMEMNHDEKDEINNKTEDNDDDDDFGNFEEPNNTTTTTTKNDDSWGDFAAFDGSNVPSTPAAAAPSVVATDDDINLFSFDSPPSTTNPPPSSAPPVTESNTLDLLDLGVFEQPPSVVPIKEEPSHLESSFPPKNDWNAFGNSQTEAVAAAPAVEVTAADNDDEDWGDFNDDDFGDFNNNNNIEATTVIDVPSSSSGLPEGWNEDSIMNCSIADLAELLISMEMIDDGVKATQSKEIEMELLALSQMKANSSGSTLYLNDLQRQINELEQKMPPHDEVMRWRRRLLLSSKNVSLKKMKEMLERELPMLPREVRPRGWRDGRREFLEVFERGVGASAEMGVGGDGWLPLMEQVKIDPNGAINRQRRAKRCFTIYRSLTTNSNYGLHWKKMLSTIKHELTTAYTIISTVKKQSETSVKTIGKLTKVRDYIRALAECVRMERYIVATVSDLFCLDDCERSLESLEIGALEERGEVERLWDSLCEELNLLWGMDYRKSVPSVDDIRQKMMSMTKSDDDDRICHLTLQPFVNSRDDDKTVDDVVNNNTARVEWQGKAFMACAANLWANKISLIVP